MLAFLNRHLVQPLWAWRSGSRHLQYLRELRRRQYDPPEVVRQRQLAALQAQLRHAWETVPYYRTLWQRAGVHPEDVRTFADLRAFPVLTKADIRRHGPALLSCHYDPATLRRKRTSGSTGVPLTLYIDEPAVQWKTACTIRSDEWSGYRLGQRVAKVWGNPEYRHHGLKGRLRNWLLDRAVYLDTLGLDAARLAAFAARLRRHRPGLLFGHAHSLYLLARYWREQGGDDLRPNGIVSTAMVLHDWQRRLIEDVFARPVTNRYGCEEVSLIACECEVHRGLHVNADSVYTEVEPLPGSDTGAGHLLVTDLTNRAMPLIRYRVGDVVVPSERRCPCGRGLPLLERIEGREADYVVTPDGRLISGISLTENFALLIPGAAQVQLIQETLTDFRFRIVPEAGFGPDSHDRLAELAVRTFGPGVRWQVELVDAIPPEPTGKYRFCVSHVAHDPLAPLRG